jgi:hypothetical protein
MNSCTAAKAAATHYRRDTEMNVTDPIRRVSVVSTGEVQIRPQHVASTWQPPAHDPGAAGRLAQATGQAPALASA